MCHVSAHYHEIFNGRAKIWLNNYVMRYVYFEQSIYLSCRAADVFVWRSQCRGVTESRDGVVRIMETTREVWIR